MTVLTELVRNIMLIILLTSFLEMIMPSSSMQRFVKVVMGLFILVAILNPILNVINQQQNLEAFIWQQEDRSQAQFNSVLEQGERLQKVNQDLLWESYQQNLEHQMKSLVKLIGGVKEADVQIKLKQIRDSEELIKEVTVTINKKEKEGERSGELIKPVKIVMGEFNEEKVHVLSKEEQLIQSDILKILSQYFGLKGEQINVKFI
ncbi:MAG: stage III sporulation protein AF [Peptococcia bacterium]|jgi:stage III sporulation protein AF